MNVMHTVVDSIAVHAKSMWPQAGTARTNVADQEQDDEWGEDLTMDGPTDRKHGWLLGRSRRSDDVG